jgi:hypothetical protein
VLRALFEQGEQGQRKLAALEEAALPGPGPELTVVVAAAPRVVSFVKSMQGRPLAFVRCGSWNDEGRAKDISTDMFSVNPSCEERRREKRVG